MSFILRLFLFTTDSIASKMAHLVESIPDEVRLDPLLCSTPGKNIFMRLFKNCLRAVPNL